MTTKTAPRRRQAKRGVTKDAAEKVAAAEPMESASDIAAKFAKDHGMPTEGEGVRDGEKVRAIIHAPAAEATDAQGLTAKDWGVKPSEITVVPKADPYVDMLERLATNPEVDITKFERLVKLQQETVQFKRSNDQEDRAQVAKLAYFKAFSAMQAVLPEADEHGGIKNNSGETQSTYGRWEDIMRVLRPVLAGYGFSLFFETQDAEGGNVKTIGTLVHEDGYSRESQFTAPADKTGNKNSIQAVGSTRSYGKRYTAFDLLNITTRGQDDDGVKSENPEPPEGFESWEHDMMAAGDEGIAALSKAWNASGDTEAGKDFRDYASKYRRADWKKLREAAKDVTAKQQTREPGQEG